MGTTDPLEPADIPGQNPNTPERLQGEMKIGSTRRPALLIAVALAALATVAGLFVLI